MQYADIDESGWRNYLDRIDHVHPDQRPSWGKMNAAQMMAHCAEVTEVFTGKPLRNSPWIIRFMGPLIKKMVLNDRPYNHNTKTHPQYLVADERQFTREKQRLLDTLGQFRQMSEQEHLETRHALFGKLTKAQKTQAVLKHLDHHLNQFGV